MLLFVFILSYFDAIIEKLTCASEGVKCCKKNQRVFVHLKHFLVSPPQTGGLPLFLVSGDIFQVLLNKINSTKPLIGAYKVCDVLF